jgi:ribosomal protein S21
MEVRRRKNENVGSFLYRFSKRVQQSGVLKEVKKRRAHSRPQNRRKRRLGALYRQGKKHEIARMRKYGFRQS